MADFVNTIAVLGEDTVMDSIIERTITEFRDDTLGSLRDFAFRACKNLTMVDLPNVSETRRSALASCTSLVSVNLPRLEVVHQSLFDKCTSLVEVDLPSLLQPAYGIFSGCTSLTTVKFGGLEKFNADPVFPASLHTLVMPDSDTVCPMNSNYLKNTKIASGDGYVYVPRALLSDTDATKDYRRSTNWSIYVNQYRAREDYPDICGG